MASDKLQNWRRGEPTRTLPGATDATLTQWRRGEPVVGLNLTLPPITGSGSLTAAAGTLTGTGTVAGTAAGRHALAVTRVRRPITGRGTMRATAGFLDGLGTVSDDEVALELAGVL